MEAIKDVQGIWSLFPDHLEIGHPHIATNIFQLLAALFAKFIKEPQQSFGPALHAAPEKSPGACIQLVDHGQILVPLEHFDLINPDLGNAVEVSVGKAIFDYVLTAR